MNFFEIHNLHLHFGGVLAISDLSWTLAHPKSPSTSQRGIVSIIGPNGAGKSTLFNLISGIYTPSSGKIYFEGQAIHNRRPEEISHLGIARTFQNNRFLPGLCVMDQLLITSLDLSFINFLKNLARMKKSNTKAQELRQIKASTLLKDFGLEGIDQKFPETLSYGTQKKIEIVRSLMRDPKLLLLDEPAAGLNPTEKQNLAAILKKFSTTGTQLILIEHDMNFVMNLSESILVLHQGKRLAYGSPQEIQRNPEVQKAYLGGLKTI